MKKSLKYVYSSLLKEENSEISFSDPLKRYEEGIFFGNFSNASLALWNEKDGSGGRGEYTVASHFLSSSSTISSFKIKKIKDFFKDLNSEDIFYKLFIENDQELETIRQKIISQFNILNIKYSKDQLDDDSFIEEIRSRNVKSNRKFTLTFEDETTHKWGTSIRLFNKVLFLKDVRESSEEYFERDQYAYYDLINSVTTSGEGSKSTDVFIENNRIKDSFKTILNLGNNDLSIEVKEVSSVTKSTQGGAGIRLASGSKLAAMQSDIVFCLTIISVISDISQGDKISQDESSTFYDKKDLENDFVDILSSLKNNQVSATKIQRLIDIMFKENFAFYEGLYELISSSNNSIQRKKIAFEALENLKSIFREASYKDIRSSLDSIVIRSIEADFLCLLNGNNSSVYKKDSKALGKKQFLLIHKSAFEKVLGFSSYQNGGTAYTAIKNKALIKFLDLFFNPGDTMSENYLQNSKKLCISERRQIFLDNLKKNTITEGGLAGHMMHPYEALDMTPSEMIARIKEYGVPQSIIEKVDGQNLFFTVEKDGTLLFARNKEDMTHDDLVQKFTGHPAELPFVEGGNAIKRGVDQWLSSAGDFASQEILDIFHPDEETRSFINFEIMHPEKPNQIVYDEKYIVFHNITDFVDGREQVYSSSTDGRLQRLITLMESGVNSAGFILASNREVDLNKLTDTQIARYIDRVKDVVDMLEISEDQYLADGILSVIDKELKSEGVNISEEALSILKDFVIYGQTKSGESIKSKDFTKLMDKEDVVKLRKLGLTSATKVLGKVSKILSPFKDIFVDLGIDLLSGVKSSYMSAETSEENINVLRDKLQTAMNDLDEYMRSRDEEEYSNTVKRLIPHINKIKEAGLDKVISSSVEGGVYDYQADLIKVTGGFAPMNQILGAAYRDKEDIFPMFKEKFMQKEGNRKSLKDVFSLIY
jgi:hypothetical protein